MYVLFSHFRQRDGTRGNSFFQMSSYARANVRITNEKTKANSHEGITWSEMGKRNVQAKEVYSWENFDIVILVCKQFSCFLIKYQFFCICIDTGDRIT